MYAELVKGLSLELIIAMHVSPRLTLQERARILLVHILDTNNYQGPR